MRYSASGNPMTSFSIASNHVGTPLQPESSREETEWFNCTAFGRLADTCNQYLSRGQQVYVEGRLALAPVRPAETERPDFPWTSR